MARMLGLLAIPFAILGMVLTATPAEPEPPKKVDVAKAVGVLQNSKDPLYLQKTAMGLLKSGEKGSLEKVVPFLRDPKFLERLDPDSRTRSPESWKYRLFCLLHAVAELGTDEAEETLLKLSEEPAYTPDTTEFWIPKQAIIRALGFLKKKPSAKVLTFLEAHSAQPDGIHTAMAVRSLLRLRAPETCRIVERRLLSDTFDRFSKEYWLVDIMRLFRYDSSTVGLYERLLAADIKEKWLRDAVVTSLFGNGRELQLLHDAPTDNMQMLKDASTEILKRLVPLSDTCLKLDIDAETKETVRRARKEIAEILADREKKK